MNKIFLQGIDKSRITKRFKNFRLWLSIGADIGGIIALGVMIWGRINLSGQIQDIENKLDQNDAEVALQEYFINIESGNFTGAYNILTEKFQANHNFDVFTVRLEDFIMFDGLKITYLPEKDSAIHRTFLTEFNFDERYLIPAPTKWGITMRFDGEKRKINALSVLYENGKRSNTSCEFYPFEHCK